MRILITTFTFSPQSSGVSEVARSQAVGLVARGHEVMIATDFDPNRKQDECPGVEIRQFDVSGCANLRIGTHGETDKYRSFINQYAGDLILCNGWNNWATDLAVEGFRRTTAKKVMVSHGFGAHIWYPFPRFAWGLGEWLGWQPYVLSLPWRMKAFDHMIFLSHRKDFGRFIDHRIAALVAPGAISVIPNGFHPFESPSSESTFRERYGIETRNLVLNVANYSTRKNQLATLQAFVRAGRNDSTLVFIGSEFNDYSALLQMERDKHPSARILILTNVPREDIIAATQTADVFLLTAKAETQPLVILDAMAAGVPFISTDVGCVAELSGGMMVHNESEAARALNDVLDKPALAERLGKEGREAAEACYTWEKVLDQYERLFARLVNDSAY